MEGSESFIKRIKEENIKPIPKWRFTSRNITIWILVLLSTLLGAVAFSVILFVIQQIEFNLISHMSHSRIEMWLGLLPFLWIIMLAAAMLISIFGLKRTKKGYKFPVSRIVGGNVIFSIMLGTLFFLGGGAQWFENAFDVNVGFYEGVEEKKIKMWSLPEEGYLSGTISQVKGSTIVIVDNHKQTWEVDIEDAKIFTLVELTIGERVKLIGTVVTDTFFDASEVRPWGGFGRGGSRHGKNQGQNE